MLLEVNQFFRSDRYLGIKFYASIENNAVRLDDNASKTKCVSSSIVSTMNIMRRMIDESYLQKRG